MEEVKEIAANSLVNALKGRGQADRMQIKNRLRDDISRFIYQKTKRRPVILPILVDL